MKQRATLDDVPQIVAPMRSYQKSLLRESRYKILFVGFSDIAKPLRESIINPQTYQDAISGLPGFFGAYKHLEAEVKDVMEFSRVRELNTFDYLKDKYPDFISQVRELERRYGLHRSMSLDLMFGKASALTLGDINSKFTRLMAKYVINAAFKQPANRSQFQNRYATLNLYAQSLVRDTLYYQIVAQH